MVSLKDYDYMQLMDRQPLSQNDIEKLQEDNGSYMGDRILRKNMISFGAYLAIRIAEEHGLDREYLFSHIDTDRLAKCGYYSRTPGNCSEEDFNASLLRDYIMEVVDEIFITTQCGMKIMPDVYDRIADIRVQWINEHGEMPSAKMLAEMSEVKVEVAEAVQVEEEWKKQRAMELIEDRERFWRLILAIRESDYQYIVKMNFIHTLSELSREEREFFYYLYGADDGIVKSIGEVAAHFGMEPSRANEIFFSAMGRRHHYFPKLQSKRCKDRTYEALTNFLGEDGREEALKEICGKNILAGARN